MNEMLIAKKAELQKRDKKGFTLMEMLIVVAIIAILVAIAIPVFTTQLNKAKESADEANARSIYALVTADYMTNGAGATVSTLTNKKVTVKLNDTAKTEQTFTFSDICTALTYTPAAAATSTATATTPKVSVTTNNVTTSFPTA